MSSPSQLVKVDVSDASVEFVSVCRFPDVLDSDDTAACPTVEGTSTPFGGFLAVCADGRETIRIVDTDRATVLITINAKHLLGTSLASANSDSKQQVETMGELVVSDCAFSVSNLAGKGTLFILTSYCRGTEARIFSCLRVSVHSDFDGNLKIADGAIDVCATRIEGDIRSSFDAALLDTSASGFCVAYSGTRERFRASTQTTDAAGSSELEQDFFADGAFNDDHDDDDNELDFAISTSASRTPPTHVLFAPFADDQQPSFVDTSRCRFASCCGHTLAHLPPCCSFLCTHISKPILVLSHSVNAIMCSLASTGSGSDKTIALSHSATAHAFAYILRSKHERRFVYVYHKPGDAAEGPTYSFIVEPDGRYLYAYCCGGADKNRGAQWVVDLWNAPSTQSDHPVVRGMRVVEDMPAPPRASPVGVCLCLLYDHGAVTVRLPSVAL
ncbi:hypothetical protein HDU84_002201 [Entophlyctis sp. JEL0112]|nr:hypothetical protein HDU84_002201 [Entophlyctis sp. JEL0112]